MPRQQESHPVRQAEHPLANRHLGEYMVDQVGSDFRDGSIIRCFRQTGANGELLTVTNTIGGVFACVPSLDARRWH